ncbi:MAG: hypothetical protein ACP5M9_00290 [Candidatus Micrarchaeia archaeon]
MKMNILYVLLAIIILAGLYVAITYNNTITSSKVNTSNVSNTSKTSVQSSSQTELFVPIQLTDPPHVPYGTQALTISYSSFAVTENYQNGTSTFVNINESGKINLMTLTNLTQVIGGVNIVSNSIISQVMFNVTSADITINNTNYTVNVPSSKIIANINSKNRLVVSNSSILLDFSPTIATIFTANSTVFVLLPSVKAIIIGNSSMTSKNNQNIGARFKLNASERQRLESSVPNLTIVSSSLSQSNSSTSFSVTVKNNGNQSVVLNHILLYGTINSKIIINNNPIIKINASAIGSERDHISIINSSSNLGIGDNQKLRVQTTNAPPSISTGLNSQINTTVSVKLNTSSSDKSKNENNSYNTSTDSSQTINSSVISNLDLNSTDNSEINVEEHVGVNLVNFRVLNFLISQSGNLYLPSVYASADFKSPGYILLPGKNETFTFNGNIIFGHENSAVSAAIVPGNNYNIRIIGEEGTSASENITAS